MAQQHFEAGSPAFSENLIHKWSGKWEWSKKNKRKQTFKTSKTSNIHTLHICAPKTPIPVIFPQCCKDSSQKHCGFCSPKGFRVHSPVQGLPLLPTLYPLCAFGSGKTTRKAEFSTTATPGSWDDFRVELSRTKYMENPQVSTPWTQQGIAAPKANGSHRT